MKLKTNIGLFILTALAAAILLASCNMGATEDLGSVKMELSSRVIGPADTARIWLVPEGTTSFLNLGEQHEQTISGATLSLEKIPAGISYSIYISLGTKSGGVFTQTQAVNGTITVAGGDSANTATLKAETTKASALITGKNLKSVAVVNDASEVIYAVDSTNLYSSANSYTGIAAPAGFTINSVTNGTIYPDGAVNVPLISGKVASGKSIQPYSGGFISDFSGGLPGKMFDAGAADTTIDVLSTDSFTGLTTTQHILVSQINGGLIIAFYDNSDPYNEINWVPINLEEFLSEAGLSLAGELVRGIEFIPGANESGTIYMLSKAGNFMKTVSWSAGSTVPEDLGTAFPAEGTAMYLRKFLNIGRIGSKLYFGTDNGLYSADPDAVKGIKNETLVAATAGKRIKLLECSESYIACVTDLELIIAKPDGTAESVAFNDGLPVNNALTGDGTGITALAWGTDGKTLYMSGDNGLAKIDVSTLF